MSNLTKQWFNDMWKDGYYFPSEYASRGYGDYGINLKEYLLNILKPDFQYLEIGVGGCYWPKELYSYVKHMILVDVIPENGIPAQHNIPKEKYTWLEVGDYNLSSIEDNSIDFVYSFDVFCHLNLAAKVKYLNSINRVLKAGHDVIIMMPNWKHCADLVNKNPTDYIFNDNSSWFYDDPKFTLEYISNFTDFDIVNPNVFPSARDTVVHLRKKYD